MQNSLNTRQCKLMFYSRQNIQVDHWRAKADHAMVHSSGSRGAVPLSCATSTFNCSVVFRSQGFKKDGYEKNNCRSHVERDQEQKYIHCATQLNNFGKNSSSIPINVAVALQNRNDLVLMFAHYGALMKLQQAQARREPQMWNTEREK